MSRADDLDSLFADRRPSRWPRLAGHGLIRGYQLSISMLVGRWCRHLPTCSAYMDEAVMRHGLWAGGWMGLARLCRCHPYGTAGIDNPPLVLPPDAGWLSPWRYGNWRWRRGGPVCEAVGAFSSEAGTGSPHKKRASSVQDATRNAAPPNARDRG